jgi:hypothetical protein
MVVVWQVSLEVALNGRNYIAITPTTTLRYTYYVQPRFVKAISPTGGRVDGGTLVTIDGGGTRLGSNLTIPGPSSSLCSPSLPPPLTLPVPSLAGFSAYAGVNISDLRVGWNDTQRSNLTAPTLLTDSRIVVRAFPAAAGGFSELYVALNTYNLLRINA